MYQDYENSPDIGTPIELYEFTQGTKQWAYVSGADLIEHSNKTYKPSPITRSRIKQTQDIFKDSLTLTFPRGDEFASQFIGFAPEEITTVTVLRGHYQDPDAEFITYWKGRVVGAMASKNTVDIECESVFTSIKRPGLRARFELTCRHALYQSGCNVNRELFKHEGTVLSIANELDIQVSGAASQPDGYYVGGMLIGPDGGSRFLTKHVSDVVTLSRRLPELTGAVTVSIYPGCDHLKETCNNKFNNLDNFGGFPYIPERNPFDGSSLI